MNIVKPETRKKVWIFILCMLIFNFFCLALFIWGVVELSLWKNVGVNEQLIIYGSGIFKTKKSTELFGGLLVGIDSFILLFTGINLAAFLSNYTEYKNDFKNFFKKKEKNKETKKEIETKNDDSSSTEKPSIMTLEYRFSDEDKIKKNDIENSEKIIN